MGEGRAVSLHAGRLRVDQLIQSPLVEADDGLPIHHDDRSRHRAHPPQVLDGGRVPGQVLLLERNASSRKILFRLSAGRSARLCVDRHALRHPMPPLLEPALQPGRPRRNAVRCGPSVPVSSARHTAAPGTTLPRETRTKHPPKPSAGGFRPLSALDFRRSATIIEPGSALRHKAIDACGRGSRKPITITS